MKNINLLSTIFLCAFFLMTSCSSSDDCHECHIALYNAAGVEVAQHEIGEFCGNDLQDVESAGYNLENAVTYTDQDSTYTLSPGLIPGDDVHCEEHANHDH
jgi:hypothetical protein|tara:strand:- start:627 stop:929 length:303 start_codon:yes stop_codon:yes gene_type:complete